MAMSSEAKRLLSSTIRSLRERLVTDLSDAANRAYRLSIRSVDAGLSEARRARRDRLQAWIDEQVRAEAGRELASIRKASWAPDEVASRHGAIVGRLQREGTGDRFLRDVVSQAAYTLLNRVVLLRLLEASGLREPRVVTGGYDSPAYKDFRALAPALVRDESEGYGFLLDLVFSDLATELPGLYGPQGFADFVPVPAETLRALVTALDHDGLASCWTDELTLGWIYQYWNDPEREALDAKLHAGGKVEPHEVASKTQMFTERYMVDWLLQNSLGPMWLAMCRRSGWTPEVEADGTLARLEARRVEWRARREERERALAEAKARAEAEPGFTFDEDALPCVSLTALMPLETDAERRWAYYVPQPIPDDAVDKAPASVRALRVLDPAVGSGHFLVVAFDLLFALHREEARHRGLEWSDRSIVEHIVSENLHGIDIDPRAVQIAAAALWLKARQTCTDARPPRMNLVASALRLSGLPDDDPALVELRAEVERETGIPGALTDTVIHALAGADHLGSLLKVDRAVDDAIRRHETQVRAHFKPQQADLFQAAPPAQGEIAFEREAARRSVLDRLEAFLGRHTGGDDLGLRLRGEQLAAGVRFVRMVREGTYDLVVANPPYQGTSKMADARYVTEHYPLGKADLYAAFLVRGLELVREGGVSAMLTMRNWMFIKQFAGLRGWLLEGFDLRGIGDFAVGAFDSVPNDVLSVAVSVFHRCGPRETPSVAQQPTPPDDKSYDRARTARKRAATLCLAGRYEFRPEALRVVPEWPVVYWWEPETLRAYRRTPLIGAVASVRLGVRTSDNARFLRVPWEREYHRPSRTPMSSASYRWAPYIRGGEGRAWVEPLNCVLLWNHTGLEIKTKLEFAYGMSTQSPEYYFRRGVAFSMIGASFAARVHRYPSICGDMGSSVFPDDAAVAVCAMNASRARTILQALNPGMHFQVGDVNRLPLFPIANADAIFATIESAFTTHESHREPSVEFHHPGPSPWRHAQEWAQAAVDRPDGAPLPPYAPVLDPEPATDHLSFALGVALGRFSADGAGVLDPSADDLSGALPAGVLFLDGSLEPGDDRDGLGHPAVAPLHAAWAAHKDGIGSARKSLREYLALDFFKDVHKSMYEGRPIHWPLSSERRTFVAWVTIHRWTEDTLRVVLADHLNPALARMDGALADLRAARDGADPAAAKAAERRFAKVLAWREELAAFIKALAECAETGPPPTDKDCPKREQDARVAPDLDDGVMVNSAALWPLLEPQWKDPKKWTKELSSAKGKKDYDWSHLAMRYWPVRVDAKCKEDPSLAVAHGCFWKYHPNRAWPWELRLQDEIAETFRIEEPPYRGDEGDGPHRESWLRDHPKEALEAVEKEALRRRRKKKQAQEELRVADSGLWTTHPEACWTLELSVIQKQGADFHLRAPDEPEARARYESGHPAKSAERANLLATLTPPLLLEEAPEDEPQPEEEEEVA